MADCLTQCAARNLKLRLKCFHFTCNHPGMNQTLFIIFLFMGICIACLVTFVPKMVILMFPFNSRRLVTSGVYPYHETSVAVRFKQKLPINSGKNMHHSLCHEYLRIEFELIIGSFNFIF